MATAQQIYIPTPKQPKQPDLTRDQRLYIQTLFFDANYTRDQICLQTGHTYNQVYYANKAPSYPSKTKDWPKSCS
jgi:hypothetical protein